LQAIQVDLRDRKGRKKVKVKRNVGCVPRPFDRLRAIHGETSA
jgi:hypothetical protein